MLRRSLSLALLPAMLLALGACAGAPASPEASSAPAVSSTPLTLDNCGESVTFTSVPRKAVTLNQGATEVMLALDLGQSMVGTAYLDDQVPARWKKSYDAVPVLSKQYPSKEAFLGAGPDFAYASFASAFTDKGVGTREELSRESVSTYLSPFGCPKGTPRAKSTMDSAWREVSEVASIFGVPERATMLIAEQRDTLAGLRSRNAGQGRRVLWYDSGDKSPLVGAGQGGPQIILDAVGAKNIFADTEGNWANGSWEKVVSADPEVIVVADASWSRAKDKIAYLEADPVLRKLRAVRNKAYVTIPFSQSVPGVSLVDGAVSVSDQLGALPK